MWLGLYTCKEQLSSVGLLDSRAVWQHNRQYKSSGSLECKNMDVSARFKWRKVRPGGKPGKLKPTNYRYLCSVTLAGHYIFVIGGFSKIFSRTFSLLNLNTKTWSRVIPRMDLDYVFRSHTVTLFEDSLLIYGSILQRAGRFEPAGEVLSYSTILNEVKVLPTFDVANRPRYKQEHTAEILEPNKLLVVFGGLPKADTRQLYLLDLSSWKWSWPQEKGAIPTYRRKHGSCIVGSRLFVYSGKPGSDEKADIYTVDIVRRDVVHWQHVAVHGDLGPERLGAAMHYVGGGRIFVFGGFEIGIDDDSKDLLVVDHITSNKPICSFVREKGAIPAKYSYTGPTPSARECSRFVLTSNKLILIGGSAGDGSSYFELSPE